MLDELLRLFGKNDEPDATKLTLAEALRGVSVDRIQSVGAMQVIPLTSDFNDPRFVAPGKEETATIDYGKMRFGNMSDRTLIVPCHATCITQHFAQNHAMSHAGIVPAKSRKAYASAMCVQETQGGLIPNGVYPMVILPYALREQALDMRTHKSLGRLWKSIRTFNRGFGIRSRGNLDVFLDNFKRELDRFVAEFECVPKQVGAIILIDGAVVGIERAPSEEYWRSVWRPLIRECYGSFALEAMRSGALARRRPLGRLSLSPDISSLAELERTLTSTREAEEEETRAIVRELLHDELSVQTDERVGDLCVDTLSAQRFTGQVIRDGRRIVYASIVARREWAKNGAWQEAQEFSI